MLSHRLIGDSYFYLMLVQLDLYLLSQKWKELVEKARAKQLQPHEYNSGYFVSIEFITGFLGYLRGVY